MVKAKTLEYKVKKEILKELLVRIDIIPTSIALAQAAKKVVGDIRFALEEMPSLVSGLGAVKV